MIYRTQVKIIADVLSATKESDFDNRGIGVTTIIRKANLSHPRLMKILSDLVNSGLLEENVNGKTSKYKLSMKGQNFLLEYNKFHDFATTFGLRL
ncbi:MAG TPA: winged helix-turn-helix domain-containing protein [Nitrososphaerales archaeon]|nr:winged helix-turn-helix domain-containing protein [Nitrososphaerales archaeon]